MVNIRELLDEVAMSDGNGSDDGYESNEDSEGSLKDFIVSDHESKSESEDDEPPPKKIRREEPVRRVLKLPTILDSSSESDEPPKKTRREETVPKRRILKLPTILDDSSDDEAPPKGKLFASKKTLCHECNEIKLVRFYSTDDDDIFNITANCGSCSYTL
jgi:hypothetical protein